MGISVSVSAPERRVVEIPTPPPAPTVAINRTLTTAHLNDLLDVTVTAIPEPYPDDLDFDQDQRYSLVFKKGEGWIAAPEPVITAIDGGTY